MPRSAILAGLLGAVALGIVANLFANNTAYSQTAPGYIPIGVSPGVGALSTAWFIDPGARRVIMCTGTEGRSPDCSAAAIP
ncbi:MAG: hypothetical protein NFCOHLIN_02111 [Gammaproteobacteria bacterium]|nr:hypothetical protein [Gammaproteobacteria bacterium]